MTIQICFSLFYVFASRQIKPRDYPGGTMLADYVIHILNRICLRVVVFAEFFRYCGFRHIPMSPSVIDATACIPPLIKQIVRIAKNPRTNMVSIKFNARKCKCTAQVLASWKVSSRPRLSVLSFFQFLLQAFETRKDCCDGWYLFLRFQGINYK